MAAGIIPSDNIKYTQLGTVIKIKRDDGYGFIKPAADLPHGFTQRDVFFSLRVVSGDEVEEGDIVEFLLREGSDDKAEACFVLVCFKAEKDYKKPTHGPAVHVEKRNKPTQEETVDVDIPYKKQTRASAVQVRGRICRLMDNGNGFIQVKGEVPAEFEGYKDIYFNASWMMSGGMDLRVGDTVLFNISLSNWRENELTAHRIKLVSCRPRSPADIDAYIIKVTDKVNGLTEADSDELLQILRCEAVWKAIGRCWAMQEDTISRLLNLLHLLHTRAKVFSQNYTQLLHTFTSTNFCSTHSGCFKLYIQQVWAAGQQPQQAQVKQFLLLVLEHLPGKARTVAALVKSMIPPGEDSTEHFLYNIIKKMSTQHLEDVSEFEWSELPLVPSAAELMSPLEVSENINHVKTHNPYESVEEYVDTYFRLLRADCFSGMRSGIQDFLRNDLDPRDMNIYSEISLVSVRITNYRNGLTLGLKVKPKEKIDDWKTCSNLQFGNLVCLSPTGTFKDPIWATVIERNPELLNTHQVIWVELCSASNCRDDSACISDLLESSGRTILAESPTYYIAYQPILKTLQKSDTKTLAFQDELVNLQPPSPPPSFNAAATEPPVPLDESQHEAFTQALSQRIAIIQGPPGTGKTFLGICLIKHILQQQDRDKSPILVLTYKNHTLDEFMKAVLQFLPGGVARVGGRSQEPKMEECNMQTLKKEHRRSQDNFKQKQCLMLEVNEVKASLNELIHKLHNATKFSVNTLLTEFDVDQVEDLINGAKLYDTSSGTEKPVDQTEIEAVFARNKDILLETETSVEEKIAQLDVVFMDFLLQALEQWLPPPDALQEIMKGEERLAQLIASHTNTKKHKKEKRDESDSDMDEKDSEAEEKERLAAVWIPRDEREITVRFDDQDGDRSAACLAPAARRLAAKFPLLAVRGFQDLWGLSGYDRAQIIQVVLWYQKEAVEQQLKAVMGRYKEVLAAVQELEDQNKVAILQQKQVIGMTITGASIHHALLLALRPSVVLVEEAAAVLEPQIMAVLGDWVKHLILIGDHQQLRPSVDSYMLARDYHLDVSMMERLINNNYPYSTLHMQNRMLPDMAELLHDIYPDLTSNLERVGDRTPPDFLPPMYFWAHEDEETVDRSYSNVQEAERVVRLALLFLQQGYEVTQVTVLAAYQAQVKLLRSLLQQAVKHYPGLFPEQEADQKTEEENNIKVHTIDGYQGDENEIIIVSLVRSNTEGQIGFLKTINRRCVAQSRAQCGMYFVGNIATLLKAKRSCWLPFVQKLNEKKLVGMKLPLHCNVHGATSKLQALTADDIPLTGICNLPCQELMECGLHSCTELCQSEHDHTGCEEEVDFVHPTCGHVVSRMCHQSEHDHTRCEEEVEFVHPTCGHVVSRVCHQSEANTPCSEPCAEMMPCGRHPCTAACQPPHPHLATSCTMRVEYCFPVCRHVLRTKKCGEEASALLCSAKVPFKFPMCGHFGIRRCWELPEDVVCRTMCTQRLFCGHCCEGLCGHVCNETSCMICTDIHGTKIQPLDVQVHGMSRQPAHVEETTQQTAHVEDTTQQTAHVEGTTQQTAHVEETTQQTAHVEETTQQTAHVEETTQQTAHVEDTTQQTAHVEETTQQTAHVEETTQQTAHVEETTQQTAHVEEATQQTAHDEETTQQTAHVEETTQQTAHVEETTQQTAHVEETTQQTAHVEDTTQQTAHVEQEPEQPAYVEGVTELLVCVEGVREQPASVEGVREQPACVEPAGVEGVREQPACVEPAGVEGVREQPACVEGVREQPACVEGVRELLVRVEGVREQPACVEGVREQPACVEMVREQPACVEMVREQPACVDGVREQPACVEGVREQPACVEMVREQPACVEPACVEGVREQPACVEGVREQPACVEGVTEQSASVEGVTEQPACVEGVREQPACVEGVTELLVCVEGVTQQPACVEGVTEQPAGVGPAGVELAGVEPAGVELAGVELAGVELLKVKEITKLTQETKLLILLREVEMSISNINLTSKPDCSI